MATTNPQSVRARVALDLVTTTAMFLHGAKPEGRAELRTPSIKSVVRWWYRAALGLLKDDLCDPNRPPCGLCLRCHESEIFGSTATGPRVRFRIQDWLHHPAEGTRLRGPDTVLLPHRRNSSRPEVPRYSIAPGQRFTLLLDTFPLSTDVGHLATAARSTWLAAHLGGFGQRSRRGAGSIEMQGSRGHDVELPPDREP